MISGQRGRVSPLPGAGLPLPPVSPWTEEGMAVGTVRASPAPPPCPDFLEEGLEAQREHRPGAGSVGGGPWCQKHGLCICSWVTLGEAVPSLSFSLLLCKKGTVAPPPQGCSGEQGKWSSRNTQHSAWQTVGARSMPTATQVFS